MTNNIDALGNHHAPTGTKDPGTFVSPPFAESGPLASRALGSPKTACTECGEAVLVEANDVSHHVGADGNVDHDADAEHVAIPEEKLASFTYGGEVLNVFRDPDDEEGFLVRGPDGYVVGFRANPDTAPADLIEEAAEFWAADEFREDDD